MGVWDAVLTKADLESLSHDDLLNPPREIPVIEFEEGLHKHNYKVDMAYRFYRKKGLYKKGGSQPFSGIVRISTAWL